MPLHLHASTGSALNAPPGVSSKCITASKDNVKNWAPTKAEIPGLVRLSVQSEHTFNRAINSDLNFTAANTHRPKKV